MALNIISSGSSLQQVLYMYGSARLHPGFPGVRAHARETGQWVSREDLLCLPAAQQTNGQLLVQTKGKENLHVNLGPTGATERVRLLASYPSSYFFFLTWSYHGALAQNFSSNSNNSPP